MREVQDLHMTIDPLLVLGGLASPISSREAVRLRWRRLADDFARLPALDAARGGRRDVGALLLLGHDEALADAERYVAELHTVRTGHLVDYDDIDDEASLERWATELDRASVDGHAPPAPQGFWSAFLQWRTPLGMSRLTERGPQSRRS